MNNFIERHAFEVAVWRKEEASDHIIVQGLEKAGEIQDETKREA